MDARILRRYCSEYLKLSTEELLRLLAQVAPTKPSPEQLRALRDALRERDQIPTALHPATLAADAVRPLQVSARTNASIREVAAHKVEIRFPPDGYLEPDRHIFDDYDDLLGYIAANLPIAIHAGRFTLSVKRVRRSQAGKPLFTFGDVLLDMITDADGQVIIGDRVFDLASLELSDPTERAGGIYSATKQESSSHLDRLALNSMLGGSLSLVLSTPGHLLMASPNPSKVWIENDNQLMRFRAFKMNRWFYKKIGADITTAFGFIAFDPFSTASINSTYGDTFIGESCATVKTDSDSDADDYYVDEYESSGGFPSADWPADGVGSLCSATWRGDFYSRYVQKGCPGGILW